MKITAIKIRKILREGRLRAVVSVTLDDQLAIHDIKVIEGPDRLFVAMPSHKEANGAFRDIVHPISPAAREPLEQAILDAYQRELAARGPEETAHPAFAASASTAVGRSIPKYY